ncbi:MAG TPA: ATP-binding cassette domain-containing protein [Clostridiaceae bacterium]|nr:ATP-binding cassette domain-containing protein [Clostridiaceae bacterium]
MLDIVHLRKIFNPGTPNETMAIYDLNLHLKPGDFVTLIGGNGAGKSTLLNCVAGVYPPNAGVITINGNDVTFKPEHKRANFLGRVFQDPMLGTAGNMSIAENLAMASRRGKRRGLGWGISKEELEKYTEYVSRLELGLENRMSVKVRLLSGGQRQALTLLMATLQRPNLLLLDEHTAALDPRTADKVLYVTRRLVRENNLTTMMITHNMRQAIEFGNRLIMMNHGRIVLDIEGAEKKDLEVKDLLKRFAAASGEEFDSDRALLTM